jgi:sialic acid synthase SpsE
MLQFFSRSGHGVPPMHLDTVLGVRAASAIKKGTPLSWKVVS